MGQALYRKYRSKNFSEVIGQKHITDTLEKALKSGRISHAYLFTGPRGVGKTSVARILAHAVNDLPYDSNEATHLDIIEIDAASNRRIDEIRDLRDKVHITPTSAKYKVYIIDEVHMLTREAFNALLKTLEEPPAHVIFILATTEAHKLPETIISRTQRYSFKPFDIKTAADHLATVAKAEKIKIDREALELLAQFGDGSFRDSISLLDQLGSLETEITADVVRDHLGLPKESSIEQLLVAAESGRSAEVIDIISKLKDQAIDAQTVARLISARIRSQIAAGQSEHFHPELLRQLLAVGSSTRPIDTLEVAMLELASENQNQTHVEPVAPAEESQSEIVEIEITEQPAKIHKTETKASAFSEEVWQNILTEIKVSAPALYTALRLAAASEDEDKLVLAFEFPLHQKKVEAARNKEILGKAVESVTGRKLIIQCVIDKKIKQNSQTFKTKIEAPRPVDTPVEPGHLKTISNIFGSAEVLES